jgi:Glycosyltransferase like family
VIAFGCAITKPDQFQRCAEPGIRRAEEPGSERYVGPSVGSIAESYNATLDRAAQRDDLEALVLVHQDAEVVGSDLCAKAREALRDPQVGLIGCAGALDVRSIAWWEGSVTLASFINRYEEHGGGDLASFSWSWEDAPPWAQTGEVETLDGFVLIFSPWAVRTIRFDASLSRFHGYDLDYCLQVREAGRSVVTADFRAIHHRQIEMLPDPEEWIEAHIAVAEKWDGRMPPVGSGAGGWRERALRAEAERDVAGAMAYTKVVELEARARELRRGIAETRGSLSWRLTAPLRRLGAAR